MTLSVLLTAPGIRRPTMLRRALKFRRYARIDSLGKMPARSESQRALGPSYRNAGSRATIVDRARTPRSSPPPAMNRSLRTCTALSQKMQTTTNSQSESCDEYDGLIDVLKEMAAQLPDAMWFVKSWIVETGVPE